MLKSLSKYLVPVLCLAIGLVLGLLLMGGRTDVVCGALGAAYEVEGLNLRMEDGRNVYPTSPDGQSAILTYLDGVPLRGTLSDGQEGAAVTLVQRPGGAGVYSYVAAAIVKGGRVEGTNAVLLGDGVDVLDMQIADEIIWVTLLSRARGDPPNAAPSVKQTRQFYCRDGVLVELP